MSLSPPVIRSASRPLPFENDLTTGTVVEMTDLSPETIWYTDPGFTFDFALPTYFINNAFVWTMMMTATHPLHLQDHLLQLLIQDKSPLLLSVPTVQTFFSSTQPQRKRDTFALFDNKLSRSTVYSHPVTTYGMSIATK